MKNILVLGAGLVGRHIAVDLSKSHSVTVYDIVEKPALFNAYPNITYQEEYIHPATLDRKLVGFDLVINALPGSLGYSILKAIIEAGKDVVDISFMPENVLNLRDLADKHKVTAVVDMGVAPGMCGALLGYEAAKMQNVESMKILVGGLPLNPKPPYYYKAPFEPKGVLAEYTRPVYLKENGEFVSREPLTDVEAFDMFGKDLVAFNTDGCRTLLTTFFNVPNIVEKTIRHRQHYQMIKTLQAGGFLKPEHLKNTAKVLIPHWKLEEDEKEFTVMKVEIRGDDKVVTWDLYDEWKDGVTSMARTTGYATTAAANLILDGKCSKGLVLPEVLGSDETSIQYIFDYLQERGVIYKRTENEK